MLIFPGIVRATLRGGKLPPDQEKSRG